MAEQQQIEHIYQRDHAVGGLRKAQPSQKPQIAEDHDGDHHEQDNRKLKEKQIRQLRLGLRAEAGDHQLHQRAEEQEHGQKKNRAQGKRCAVDLAEKGASSLLRVMKIVLRGDRQVRGGKGRTDKRGEQEQHA